MIERSVRNLYSMLCEGRYIDIEHLTGGEKISASEIEQEILDYGCELVQYPTLIDLDVVDVAGSDPKEWSVVAPIYTKQEGLSDLSIELSLIDNQGVEKVVLENIRVR